MTKNRDKIVQKETRKNPFEASVETESEDNVQGVPLDDFIEETFPDLKCKKVKEIAAGKNYTAPV